MAVLPAEGGVLTVRLSTVPVPPTLSPSHEKESGPLVRFLDAFHLPMPILIPVPTTLSPRFKKESGLLVGILDAIYVLRHSVPRHGIQVFPLLILAND